ncbi:hypothetical protein POM88_018263 [Heracleum sosnowskyi]|uniref:Uncharacterized protein n=1 Tax=Heracleum sosnowskyi TaxID=360622 RepID=A0AAD8IU29_9APIA|nr:hypothetical protein POM88_018263 [Heracleum sosnowskyi]
MFSYALSTYYNLDNVFINVAAIKDIVNKIVALHVEQRTWPNYLGKAIRNATTVVVEGFDVKLNKTFNKHERQVAKKCGTMSSNLVKDKSLVVLKMNLKTLDANFESHESPKTENKGEMSASWRFAKVVYFASYVDLALGIGRSFMICKSRHVSFLLKQIVS